ncbi:hypothetical protein NL676_031053 [Syzygium grande]|nr:hypothetical protein NL676_031053 [Syzygium grande]
MVVVEVSESLGAVPTFICVDSSRGVSDFSLGFLNDRVKVRASCNGLLCCSSIPDKGVHYVCNPVTREFRLLPRRERVMNRFHPDGEATLVGLACDLSAQTFSVVLAGYHRTFGHRPDGTFICFVYDSELNRWRRIVSFQEDHFTHMSRNQVVFVNGALHWLTGSSSYILVLDLHYDIWRKISLPEQLSCGAGSRIYLLELDGSLSIIQILQGWMIIWALKDYVMENWQVVDRVSLRCIRGLVPGIFPIRGSNFPVSCSNEPEGNHLQLFPASASGSLSCGKAVAAWIGMSDRFSTKDNEEDSNTSTEIEPPPWFRSFDDGGEDAPPRRRRRRSSSSSSWAPRPFGFPSPAPPFLLGFLVAPAPPCFAPLPPSPCLLRIGGRRSRAGLE